MRFPYTKWQIDEIVQAEKHPRDWEPVEFHPVQRRENSRRAEVQLEFDDGRTDRIRMIVQGRIDVPKSYRAVLQLDTAKVRGVDYHEVEKQQFYGRVVVPPGWHQDIIDPNLEQRHPDYQRRPPLPDFNPFDLTDFLNRVASLWHITLPEQNYLL